jgi:hypothetical protein
MDFGVGYFRYMTAWVRVRWQLLEQSGQDAVFFAEHTHIPASRQTPWPDGPEGTPCHDSTGTAMTCSWS